MSEAAQKLPVLLLGGTGTIGRAVLRALLDEGYPVRMPVRDAAKGAELARGLRGIDVVEAQVAEPGVMAGLMAGMGSVISCLASRTGAPGDAYAIDRDANLAALRAAEAEGVARFVLLSAICVQKPKLAFQFAKLEFEEALQASGIGWSIVRPTAYFKSLVGQVARVKKGKPYLTFGDGRGTACLPISDGDLGRYLVRCLWDPDLAEMVLPVGGPGPALTPREIGAHMFDRVGSPPRFRSVSPRVLQVIAGALRLVGQREKAELARIGHYYATESMLVWDGAAYDASATPQVGEERFLDYLDAVIAGTEEAERGEHAVF